MENDTISLGLARMSLQDASKGHTDLHPTGQKESRESTYGRLLQEDQVVDSRLQSVQKMIIEKMLKVIEHLQDMNRHSGAIAEVIQLINTDIAFLERQIKVLTYRKASDTVNESVKSLILENWKEKIDILKDIGGILQNRSLDVTRKPGTMIETRK
jgi:capsid protein